MYLLFIATTLPRTRAGAWRAKEQKQCFTTLTLLIIFQDALTIFGSKEVREFLKGQAQGKFPFESLPVASSATLPRPAASVSTYTDDGSTFFKKHVWSDKQQLYLEMAHYRLPFNSLKTRKPHNRLPHGLSDMLVESFVVREGAESQATDSLLLTSVTGCVSIHSQHHF